MRNQNKFQIITNSNKILKIIDLKNETKITQILKIHEFKQNSPCIANGAPSGAARRVPGASGPEPLRPPPIFPEAPEDVLRDSRARAEGPEEERKKRK